MEKTFEEQCKEAMDWWWSNAGTIGNLFGDGDIDNDWEGPVIDSHPLDKEDVSSLCAYEAALCDIHQMIGDDVTLSEAKIMLVDALKRKGHYVYEADNPNSPFYKEEES